MGWARLAAGVRYKVCGTVGKAAMGRGNSRGEGASLGQESLRGQELS